MKDCKAGMWTWMGIGLLSVLIPIGLYFFAYWLVADVIVVGFVGAFGGYRHASAIYHIGDYQLGDWADTVFYPAAYVDRTVLRRSLWSKDEHPMGGGMFSGLPLQDLPQAISDLTRRTDPPSEDLPINPPAEPPDATPDSKQLPSSP